MLMTRMFSETPGTPGRRQQMPRIDQVDLDAGLRGRVERFDDLGIDERVHLGDDPCRAAGSRHAPPSRSISAVSVLARCMGATISLFIVASLRVAGQQVE